MADKPIKRIRPDKMKNSRYSVSVWPYLLGQFRIQLEDHQNVLMSPSGHGQIIRELCTYKKHTMELTVERLRLSDEPSAESLAFPWNCDGPGGRIRLDNRQEDRPEFTVKIKKEESL